MACRFSDRILKVMSVSGYHAGDEILVEVDIGMHPPPSTLHAFCIRFAHRFVKGICRELFRVVTDVSSAG